MRKKFHLPSLPSFAFVLLLALAGSCSTPKDITYFQDAEALNGMALQAEQQFRLRQIESAKTSMENIQFFLRCPDY